MRFGPGSQTDSGYPRVVKLWQRGQALSAATTVFEGEKTDVAAGANVVQIYTGLIYEGPALVSRVAQALKDAAQAGR